MTIDYSKIEEKIFSFGTNPKLGLDNINELLNILHLTKKNFSQPIIQVVGTNGKGSTCAFLESLFMGLGLKVGVFTSPHLACFRERIRINQKYITQDEILPISIEVFDAVEKMINKPSFFEILLAIALQYFQNDTDVIVLEAGLGGRLDATTALKADILGVCSIGLDHQAILGDTLEQITAEKIAAAYKKQKVISVIQTPEVAKTLTIECNKIECELAFSSPCLIKSNLEGEHQFINAGLAIALVQGLGFTIENSLIEKSLSNTYWPARLESFTYQNSKIIIDGAHNPHAIKVISGYLCKKYYHQTWQIVFGCLKGHDAHEMALIFKNNNYDNIKKIYLAVPKNPRALSYNELENMFILAGFEKNMILPFIDLKHIINHEYNFTLICGSLYLAGELRQKIVNMDSDSYISNY